MTGRLARGRNYARRGQVIGFEISCGYVTAQVQGSRPKPYRVQIQVTPLTTAQWRKVEQALAAQALFRARLLAGEMPPEIEEVFAGCGTPLFPRSARDLDMSCSCPDWGVPCKHLAAVCYVLAEAFDLDPFGILAWRGRGREDLLAAMRLTGREADEPARPLIDVTDRPLSECMRGLLVAGHEHGAAAGPAAGTGDSTRPAAAHVRTAAAAGPQHRPDHPAGPGLPSAGRPGRASRWLTANRRSRTAADRAVPGVESMPGLRPIAVM